MEYSANGVFEDRPTIAFLNRFMPVPSFSAYVGPQQLVILTDVLQVTYTIGQPFSAASLSIKSRNANATVFDEWTYGMHDDGNLLGTIKSLDMLGAVPLNCTENAWMTVHDEQLHCEWAVVSRNGWAIVNDTQNWVCVCH